MKFAPALALAFTGLFLLGGCATPPPMAEATPASPEAIGILSFFAGGDQGVVARNIQWGAPVTAENPGADCELKLRKQGPPTNVFSCVVKKEGEVPVVLTINESVDAAHTSRKLTRFSIDGKTEATLNRWIKDLEASDYAEQKIAGAKKSRRVFRSADGRSEAQVIWAASANAVTVLLAPAAGAAAKAAKGEKASAPEGE